MTDDDKNEVMADLMRLVKKRPAASNYRIAFCLTADDDTLLATTYADGELSLLTLAQFTAEVGRRVTSMLMSTDMTREDASAIAQSFFETGCHLAATDSEEPCNVAFDNSTNEYPIQ